jgi:hypothetical protein
MRVLIVDCMSVPVLTAAIGVCLCIDKRSVLIANKCVIEIERFV